MGNKQKHPILQKLEEYFKNTPKEQIDKDWSNILKDTDSESYYEKRYKAALDWMFELYPQLNGWIKEDAEHYFPELRESITISRVEYERLKKLEKRMDCLIQSFEIQKGTLLYGLDLLNQRKKYDSRTKI